MPRKVVTRNPHREVGVLNPGWLLDHPVEHESNLEKNFIMVALACPVVKDIVHQPITLTLISHNGESQKYTPDFRIRFSDDTQIIVEVKPEVFVAKDKDKHDLAKSQLADEGMPFLVITDKHINANGLSVELKRPAIEYGRGLSLIQHEIIRAEAGKKLTRMNAVEELAAAQIRLNDQWGEAISRGVKVRRDGNLVRFQGYTSAKVVDARKPEIESPQKIEPVPQSSSSTEKSLSNVMPYKAFSLNEEFA